MTELQACEWGLLGRGGLQRWGGSAAKVRTDFRGELVTSRVSGRPELVFEWYRRVPFYILSIAVTGLMLLVAFAVMSLTLAVLVPGQTTLLARASGAAEQTLAYDLALSRLEEERVLGRWQPLEIYREWRIDTEVRDAANARTVTVSVIAGNGRTLARVNRTTAVSDVE